jgi:TonB family protein
MKNALTLISLLLPLFAYPQTSETYYCRDRACQDVVTQSRARFSETVVRQDGVVTTTTRNLKTNEVVRQFAWRGDEPVGRWVSQAVRGTDDLDYDFELHYGEKDCRNTTKLAEVDDFLKDDPGSGYTAPIVEEKDPAIITFFVRNMRYPAKARRSGIDGVVEVAFDITETGSIENIVVTDGVHVVLDKEAVRVLRKMKFARPPMVNGTPQEVCIEMPVKFLLR